MDDDEMNSTDITIQDIWMIHGNKTVTDGSYDLPDLEFADISVTCFESNDKNSSIVYSFGAFLDNPFSFSLPTVVLQIVLITATTRVIYYLLRPIKQPRVVCDIIAGILLSPNLIGRLQTSYIYAIYPQKELVINRTLAAFGLMFYLFLNGVKMDPRIALNSGKKALFFGIFTAAVPFALVGNATFFLRSSINSRIARGRFLVFLLASLSVTAFPVLSDILTELSLLNSEIGRLAMSMSMVHAISGLFFMALFVAFNQSQTGAREAAWAMASLAILAGVVVFGFRPWVRSIARRTPRGGRVGGAELRAIVVSVIGMGLASEMAGASFAAGPLMMGLAVPDGPPLGTDLVERIGNMANEVMMPLLFMVAGEAIAPAAVLHWRAWRALIAVVLVAAGSKLAAAMGPAMYCGISLRKAFVLGLMMNFQGVIELATYINFKNGSLLEDESYTLLVLAIVVITSTSTLLVKLLYNPFGPDDLVGRRGVQHLRPNAEIRLLVCLLNEGHIAGTLGLLEASCPAEETPMCAYVLHLVELTGRASSALIAHRNKKGFVNPSKMDRLHNAFINYEQEKGGAVAVQPFTAVAPFKTMHRDVCALAGDKTVAIVIVPLPGKDASGGFSEQEQAFRSNIPHILSKAPCSVGLLVHKGSAISVLSATPANFQHHIGLLFWGGPDDREALSYAARMARRPGVTLTVTRLLSSISAAPGEEEAQLDARLIEAFRRDNSGDPRVVTSEVVVSDTEQTIAAISGFGRAGYGLIVVGRRLSWNSMLRDELKEWSEFPELGVVGDMIASSDFESEVLILVVQQRA